MRPLRLLLALALLPLATGSLVVTYQDATMTHYPARAVMAAQLRALEFPFVHPGASCGQPLAGNPNFGAFFPDTLLLLFLPLPVAFGLRFALILILGWIGARRWARSEGAPRDAAEIAASAFVLSGVFLSTWRFFNSGLALGLAPWVMAALTKVLHRAQAGDARGSRRAAAELGLWGGLEVLAGEPVIALLTALLAGIRSLSGARHGIRALAPGLVVAALIAAPQVAATLQILPDSSRERRPFPFVIATGTSVHPVRLLEQVVPFPFGRPDLRGPDGFDGHRFFDNHEPYLWTLHIGLPVLGLLILFGQLRNREERLFWATAGGAALLAFGRFLPGAKALYPLLSLGGRIRFPVKWWYVVLLCLVPLMAWAARRWEAGARPQRAALGAAVALGLAAVAVIALQTPTTALGLAGPLVSVAALAGLLLLARRAEPRRATLPALGIAASLALSNLPLLLAVLDRPPESPPRVGPGRIYSRLQVEAHPRDRAAQRGAVREFFRRATRELWPLTGALSGARYAFDRDPDGAYGDDDRAVRKALDALPWPERAAGLRAAGVSSVVTSEALPAPYREVAFLNQSEGIRLYALDSPAPPVRFASSGAASDARLVVSRETTSRLEVQVEAQVDGVLIWSRSFLSAWWARVDDRPAATVLADGHLLGVLVPAGAHRVEIGWSRRWVVTGAGLAFLGFSLAALLRRPREPPVTARD